MSRKIKFIDGEMFEYEIYKLVDQYDPILRQPTKPVDFEKMDAGEIAYYALSLAETCKHYDGLGLSANQVGVPYSMCVVNVLEENKFFMMINPVVVAQAEKNSTLKEGCLSFPGLFLRIGRPEWVEIEFRAFNGETLRKKFEGISATCAQHELDHLRGVCYTDLISPIMLDMAKRKVKANLRKIRRATTGA